MDRITRKELKQDRFVAEVGHSVEYLSEHRRQAIRIGVAAVAIIVLVVAVLGWRRYQSGQRESALNAALETYNAPVGPAQEGVRSFPTEQEKNKAAARAFSDITAKYSGSDEADIAEYYLGVIAADQGNTAEAEKRFRSVVDSGNARYASLAALPLADLYASQGKIADAEKLLRNLMDHPTDFVSKDAAQLQLGKLLAKSKPQEARKLLEPLRTQQSSVSRVAVAALAEMDSAQR